jgi:transposase
VYAARIAINYTADMIVVIDESTCNECTGDRKYGWGPINSAVELEYSFKRSERWSLLPALTINGYLSYVIFQGAIMSEILETFLEDEVLPHCNRYPAPNWVLVLGNASIYRSARVGELCERFGVRVEYLPPYSPDFNPTEMSFKQPKIWIKRNGELAMVYDSFYYFLDYAVTRFCVNIDCSGWFKRCGYPLL